MSNIFLDIGAHIGESIEVASNKKYDFSKLYAVEPSQFGLKWLLKYRNRRVIVVPCGFGNSNRESLLYGAGSVGGSIYSDKKMHWSNYENIQIKKFSDWFNEHIEKNERVWIKINVEGSEWEIIEEMSLIHLRKSIVSVLISFDVEKVPSLVGKSLGLKRLLSKLEIPYYERTENFQVKEWLDSFPELKNELSIFFKTINFLRTDIPIARNIRRVLRPLFPKRIWIYVALKFGPNRKRNFQ